MKLNQKSKTFKRWLVSLGMAGILAILATHEEEYSIVGVSHVQNELEIGDHVNLIFPNLLYNEHSVQKYEEKYFVPELSLACCNVNGTRKGFVVKQIDATTWQSIVSPSFIVCMNSNKGYQVFKQNGEEKEELSFIEVKEMNPKLYPYVQQFCAFGKGQSITKEIVSKIEEFYENERGIGYSQSLVQNACEEWKEYLTTSSVCYDFQGKRSLLLIGLESETERERVWRSITHPEITLVETVDEHLNVLESHFEVSGISKMQNPVLNESMHVIGKFGVAGSFLGQMDFIDAKILEKELIVQQGLSIVDLDSMELAVTKPQSLEQNIQLASKLIFKENPVLENWRGTFLNTVLQDKKEKLMEQLSASSKKTLFPVVSVENADGEVKTYDKLYRLFYQMEDGRTAMLVMVPDQTYYRTDFLSDANPLKAVRKTYRSVTNPEIVFAQDLFQKEVLGEEIIAENTPKIKNDEFNTTTNMVLQPYLGIEKISYASIVQEQDAFYQMCNGRLVEDINGDWNHYKETVGVEIQNEEMNGKSFLFMGLVEVTGNKKIYRSHTIPEITLVETQNKENYTIDYQLQTKCFYPESLNETFSQSNSVLNVVSFIGGKMTYEEVCTYEDFMIKCLQESYESEMKSSFGVLK